MRPVSGATRVDSGRGDGKNTEQGKVRKEGEMSNCIFSRIRRNTGDPIH